MICLHGTFYALTQHNYVRQILNQLKSTTLGCEKVNVINIYMSVLSHCVVTCTNQVFWPKSGNDRTFFLVGCQNKNRAECQPQKFENLTLVSCRTHHLRVLCMIFGVFSFALKQGVWSWQQTISSLVLTHKYPRLLHLNSPSRKTQQVEFQSVTLPGKGNDVLGFACIEYQNTVFW